MTDQAVNNFVIFHAYIPADARQERRRKIL